MASKRRISYQWQLFIPLVITIWVLITGMAFYQYFSERDFRQAQIKEQLALINARIIDAAETDIDPTPFLDFVVDYYRRNPLYDLIRITVYRNGTMHRCYGQPVPLTASDNDEDNQGLARPAIVGETDDENNHNNYFYYKRDESYNGEYVVYTVLPFDSDIISATLPSNKIFWMMLAVAILMTGISFFSTRYFGRNIRILRTI
ncbi:MAG: hypothetical protein K2F79_01125, partial [Muribaculaceae bacterium]|nr:hypothetical protein [Muribaculaceae bacterium]